jgi:hypothetical protein
VVRRRYRLDDLGPTGREDEIRDAIARAQRRDYADTVRTGFAAAEEAAARREQAARTGSLRRVAEVFLATMSDHKSSLESFPGGVSYALPGSGWFGRRFRPVGSRPDRQGWTLAITSMQYRDPRNSPHVVALTTCGEWWRGSCAAEFTYPRRQRGPVSLGPDPARLSELAESAYLPIPAGGWIDLQQPGESIDRAAIDTMGTILARCGLVWPL